MYLTCGDECVVVVDQFFTKAKIFSCPFRAERRLLGKSFKICTIDAECCAIVVQRYGGAMFVVQTILWCGMGVVYGVYLVKSRVYLAIPFLYNF